MVLVVSKSLLPARRDENEDTSTIAQLSQDRLFPTITRNERVFVRVRPKPFPSECILKMFRIFMARLCGIANEDVTRLSVIHLGSSPSPAEIGDPVLVYCEFSVHRYTSERIVHSAKGLGQDDLRRWVCICPEFCVYAVLNRLKAGLRALQERLCTLHRPLGRAREIAGLYR